MTISLDDLPTKSFCILPWVSTTIGPEGVVVPCCLWNGQPEEDFSAEHNLKGPHISEGLEKARHSEYWQKIRQMMIEGKRPSGCNICYKNEDSEYHKKHEEGYGRVHQRITQHTRHASWTGTKDRTVYKNEPLPLKFLETGISNLCNFACVMCNGVSSSIIFGAFHKGVSIPKGFSQSLDNIDVDLSGLTLVKIIGGEPMIEKKHDDLLDKIISQNTNLKTLSIEYHTNGSIFPSKRVIDQWKKCKQVRIIFSMDSVGKYAKMQRPGNYKWEDVENVVSKYVLLQETGVPVIFSANLVLTALNIGCITETCDWLYDKLHTSKTSWFHMNRIGLTDQATYIDYRNLSKQTKQRIKDKWKKWEDSNPPVLTSDDHEISRLYQIAKASIDEVGILKEPLTKEMMLKKHGNAKLWRMFKQDLNELEI